MVRLTIPAQLCFKDLALAAVFAAIDAEGDGPHAAARDEITSALGEAFNNVVLHAYRGIRGGSIEIDVAAGPDHVEIRMCDRGRGFDIEDVPDYVPPEIDDAFGALDFSALPEGGMGIFIMRSFMDEVTYARGGGGKPNVLVLRKRWHTESSAAPPPFEDAGLRPLGGAATPRKETSQSGWRMRSVAVPTIVARTAGSLRRK